MSLLLGLRLRAGMLCLCMDMCLRSLLGVRLGLIGIVHSSLLLMGAVLLLLLLQMLCLELPLKLLLLHLHLVDLEVVLLDYLAQLIDLPLNHARLQHVLIHL